MTKVTRTAEEVIEKIRIMLAAENHTNIEGYRLHGHIKSGLESWLTTSEPTIEDLRRTRPWKDIDVGEKVYTWAQPLIRAADTGLGEIHKFTESLSPLALEFARIVQWLNKGANPDTCGWFAYLDVGNCILYKDAPGEEFMIVHRLHYGKDEATIKKAIEIFTPEKYRLMLGVK